MAIYQVRSPKPARSLSTGVMAVVLLTLTAVAAVAAPTAHADGIDDQFLTAVKSKGINFASPQAAILAGHRVCNELDQGAQKGDIATDMTNTGNFDGYHAGFFVGLSIAAFCPRYHTN